VHGIGGFAGMLLIGLFASTGANKAGADGLFYGGGLDQLWRQAVATFAALGYSLVVTFVVAWVLNKIIGLRAEREAEFEGIDESEHAESAYDLAVTPSRRSAVAGIAEGGRR
jgi:Amt family ammonium transporter